MAHFVRHQSPRWEFVRTESTNHKKRRELMETQSAEMEKSRERTSGLWWDDQRNVDQVAPSRAIQPDHLDTFNYKYQVYARPRCAPPSMTEVVNKKCPILYNVKRIAVDKVSTPGDSICAAHWPEYHIQTNCCPPRSGEKDTERESCQNNNNGNRTIQPKSQTDNFDDLYRLQSPVLMKTASERYNAGLHISQKENQNQGRCTLEEESKSARKYEFLSFFRENFGQQDIFNFGKRLYIQGCGAARYNCHNPMRALIESRNDRLGISVINTIYIVGISAISNINKHDKGINAIYNRHAEFSDNVLLNLDLKGVSNYPIDIGLTCASANKVANRNQDKRDVVGDLLGNQHNNISALESGVILIDNLKGTDVGINGQDLKHGDYECELQGILNIAPQILHSESDYYLCRNNNAGNEEHSRPKCVPGQYSDSMLLSDSPHQNGGPHLNRKYEYRTTPCMGMPGHLENHGRPICSFRGHSVQLNRGRASNTDQNQSGSAEPGTPEIGYMTYKIIGSRQYCEPQPKDYMSMVKLPQHLQEYREFTRRCPNPTIGRYDRSDPANEMMLPSHKASNTIHCSRNPFSHTKNPRRYTIQPLFYQPKETDQLCWNLPSATLGQQN